ncbi:protein ALTERED PHOSPHATE STARVATION RESPONSE 1-like isoform X2 [Rutidosis leptorrhynchoides]|uniref:protein ALTERED PHOSPHATE STARVATION RESPONSE 1-like isoform X2 n=1 Tax=Rutidosis leptorrhynchoides TaxID=125765 RepID=UPI003A9A2F86
MFLMGKNQGFLAVNISGRHLGFIAKVGKLNVYGKSLNLFFLLLELDPEILYEWEKKLYAEVKNAESLKIEHEKNTEQLRKIELKRRDYVTVEKSKKEVEKLESRIIVSAQAIDVTGNHQIMCRL